MDCRGFLDNKTIFDKLTDVLTRVGVSYLCRLIGVQPDLALTTLEY